MDQEVFYLINHQWAHPALDRVMAVASSWDFWWPIVLFGCVVIFALGGFRARAMLISVGLAVGITDGVVVGTLKTAVGRPRPHEVLVGVRTLDLAKARPRVLALNKPLREKYSNPVNPPRTGKSFPSGHTANTFAVATGLTLFYRRWGWLAFVPAGLVAYSRIYVGSHWPVDVVASCLLGAGLAWLVVHTLAAAWKKWGGRWFPPVFARHPALFGR